MKKIRKILFGIMVMSLGINVYATNLSDDSLSKKKKV